MQEEAAWKSLDWNREGKGTLSRELYWSICFHENFVDKYFVFVGPEKEKELFRENFTDPYGDRRQELVFIGEKYYKSLPWEDSIVYKHFRISHRLIKTIFITLIKNF